MTAQMQARPETVDVRTWPSNAVSSDGYGSALLKNRAALFRATLLPFCSSCRATATSWLGMLPASRSKVSSAADSAKRICDNPSAKRNGWSGLNQSEGYHA